MIIHETTRRHSSLWLSAALMLAIAGGLQGCAQFVLLGYLIGGPPSIEPNFDAETGLSLKGKDKTVAVVCYAPTELQYDYPKVDAEVASAVAYRLAEHGIKVVHPDYVKAWIDENSDWDRAEEIGEALKATHIIDIELVAFSLYEENSHTLYRGRSEVYLSVIEMQPDGTGEKVFATELDSLFPTQMPRPTTDISYVQFKREYLSRLSESIGWNFYERYNGDMIPWAN
jgi:hypothetical protein